MHIAADIENNIYGSNTRARDKSLVENPAVKLCGSTELIMVELSQTAVVSM